MSIGIMVFGNNTILGNGNIAKGNDSMNLF